MPVQLLILALLFSIMIYLPFLPGSLPPQSPEATTAVLGFILLASFFFGRLTAKMYLPLITGYLIAGMLFGPYGLGIFRGDDVERLAMIDSLALSFIAMAAGGEMDRRQIMKRATRMLTITGFQIVGVLVGITVLFYLLLYYSLLNIAVTGPAIFYAAIILGVIATANSPSAVVAIINESRAKGPVTETTLGVTVIKDIMVILLFAFAVSWIRSDLEGGGGAAAGKVFYDIFIDLFLSILVGATLGFFVIIYLKTLRGQMLLFTIGVAVISSELSSIFDLNELLVCIMVGFIVRNFSEHGGHFIHAIEKGSMPVFVIFFTLAGAMLNLEAVKQMWLATALYFAVRILLTWFFTTTAARALGESDKIRSYLWGGFVSQAGVSLGLAVVVKNQFPDWGAAVSMLIVASVAVNQLAGPIMFKFSLAACGEAESKDFDREKKEIQPGK
ncbi:MAG: cation:proton antiporter [Nitrospinota bacterium]